MTTKYPRTRDETGPLPEPSEIKALCKRFWDIDVTQVRSANSQCVFFCDRSEGPPVVFRANPGWDGPTPPSQIVAIVNHLANKNAPCPDILPTIDQCLSKSVRDFTISIETFLNGEVVDRVDMLEEVGKALAEIHTASEDFPNFQSEIGDVRPYITHALTYCEQTALSLKASRAIGQLRKQLEDNVSALKVRWIFCRGDVRSWNTIASPNGNIQFTDFNAAHFAPALEDVAMVRTQWLMGTQNRQLTDEEMQQFTTGYFTARPPIADEHTAFPFVFAAYYAKRLCELHRKWGPKSPNREIWQLENRIQTLPGVAIRMGEAAIERIN